MPGRGFFALALGTLLIPLGWVSQSEPVSAASSQSKETSAPQCVLRDLSVTVVGGSAVSNQEAILLRFRNSGRTGCTLNGYPKVVALRPGASSTAKDRLSIYNGGSTGNQSPVVVLQPGKSASSVVGGASMTREGQSTACYHQPYRTVRVSIPGSGGSVTLSAHLPKDGPLYLPSCSGVLATPFVAGVGWFLPH
jgi:hypothetical protein